MGLVPSSETLRQQALAATRERDRLVAKKRIMWRWFTWLLLHPRFWAMLAVTVGLVWWLGTLAWRPTFNIPWPDLTKVLGTKDAATPAPTPPDAAASQEDMPRPRHIAPQGDDSMRLRWTSPMPLDAKPSPAVSPTEPTAALPLKLDTQAPEPKKELP